MIDASTDIPVTVDRSNFFEKQVIYAVPAETGATHTLQLQPGEVFEVIGDSNKSDGFGGTYSVGLYTDLAMALDAARGHGVQGSLGSIGIVKIVQQPVTATDEGGNTVQVGVSSRLGSVSWESRLTEIA